MASVIFIFQYNQLINLLDRIAEHPYAYKFHDVIFKFRTELAAQTSRLEIPEVCIVYKHCNLFCLNLPLMETNPL